MRGVWPPPAIVPALAFGALTVGTLVVGSEAYEAGWPG